MWVAPAPSAPWAQTKVQRSHLKREPLPGFLVSSTYRGLFLAVAYLAIFPCPSEGQRSWAEANSGWSFRTGPDTSGRASDWGEVSLESTWPDLELTGYEGVVWFRRTFRPEPDRLWDAIVVGPARHGWYRIHVDGQLVGQVGSAFHTLPYPAPHLFPVDLHPEGTSVVLEFHRQGWASDALGAELDFLEGGVVVGDSAALADQLELGRKRRLMGDLLPLLLTVLFLVVGIYHVELYLHQRKERPNLWFGLATLALAGNSIIYTAWVAETTGWLSIPFRLNEAFGHLATAFLIQFLWEVLDRPIERILRWYQWSHVAIAAALLTIPFEWVYVSTPFRTPWAVPILLFAAWTLFREAYRGHPEARVIAVGGGIFIFTVALDTLASGSLGLPAGLPSLGFVAILFAMGLSLSRRFSRVHNEWGELREALEEKVRLRTSQLAEAMNKVRIASEAKSEFLANMSHELRTPLNSVIGFSELALRKQGSSLSEDDRRAFQRIQSSGQHLLGLVNKVLDISAIEAGRFDIELQETDLASLVHASVDEMRHAAEAKGLSLTVRCTQSLEPIKTDPLRVKQILINLLGNAIKFTDAGGVEVRLSRTEQGPVTLEVTDSGIGVPADRLQAIFEPFEQISGHKEGLKEGTGLGLTICKAVCGLLGAELEVASTLGEGSAFRVTFPAEEEASDDREEILMVPGLEVDSAGTPEAPPTLPEDWASEDRNAVKTQREAADGGPGLRILVVDDNISNRVLSAEMLHLLGHRVDFADDGQMALDTFDPDLHGLVLMDCQMPVMDGYQAASELRRRYPQEPRTPIIALTAHAMRGDRERCLAAGMDDYLSKPLQLSALEEMVERWRRS